jgi:hypothetical protein
MAAEPDIQTPSKMGILGALENLITSQLLILTKW